MKEVTISGSKYILSLEEHDNQWWLRLRINTAIEEELPLTHIDSKSIKTNIEELLRLAHIQLNNLQIELLQKELWDFISDELSQPTKRREFGTIEDPRYDDLVSKIDSLTSKIDNLSNAIAEKEGLIN